MNRRPRLTLVSAAAVAAALLVGCSTGPAPEPTSLLPQSIDGVQYREADGTRLLADVCLPSPGAADSPAPAMLLLHGGGFEAGSRTGSGMPALCDALAREGIVAVSVDYRLLPTFSFPAQVDDASAAVEWLRAPEQVERFGIDPTRIGVLGSSAGAIIAQSLGTTGEGALDSGARVSLVVSLSGASDLTPAALDKGDPSPEAQQIIQAYLGCVDEELADCELSTEASPQSSVDPTDPPMLLVNGDDELVPDEQATGMRDALTAAGVPVEVVIEPGAKHGAQLLTSENRRRVLEFITENLGAGVTGS